MEGNTNFLAPNVRMIWVGEFLQQIWSNLDKMGQKSCKGFRGEKISLKRGGNGFKEEKGVPNGLGPRQSGLHWLLKPKLAQNTKNLKLKEIGLPPKQHHCLTLWARQIPHFIVGGSKTQTLPLHVLDLFSSINFVFLLHLYATSSLLWIFFHKIFSNTTVNEIKRFRIQIWGRKIIM